MREEFIGIGRVSEEELTEKEIKLTQRELKQIKFQREMRWGKLMVYLKDGEPVRLEQPLKSIEL